MNRVLTVSVALVVVAAGLASQPARTASASGGTGKRVPVKLRSVPLGAPQGCSAAFKAHTLPHTTAMRGGGARFFDSNGSGLGMGDLNGDGLLDAVLGNLAGPATILWNQGGLKFRAQKLEDRTVSANEVRDVKLLDVNADGKLDIVLTHTRGAVDVWLGSGQESFRRAWLAGANTPAYTMQWDDLYGRGELNLITGSYDAALEAEMGSTFLFASNGGVAVYGPVRPDGSDLQVQGEKLIGQAQTLALLPFDVDGDGQRELIAGNDFGVPDRVWKREGQGWKQIQPFYRITRNTMSLTSGDYNNDGNAELFASDMKPNFASQDEVAKWMPLLERTYERLQYKDIQRAENTLQVRGRDGKFRNVAYDINLDATGWSWSAQFGDLDNDGFEDLYIVNGMIDEVVFKYLKNGRLIEQNRAYRNTGRGRFALNPDWQLSSEASGRSMALADFNNDGRLDAIVNNVGNAAQLFENQVCNGGNALEVELNWQGTRNLAGIGSTIRVKTGVATMQREVRSGSGYLTGTPGRVHFGIGKGQTAASLEVLWPDGARSTIQQPHLNARITITRNGGTQ